MAADLPLLTGDDPRAALSAAAAARGLRTASGRALRFVAADDAPAGIAYEAHIAATGRVPTRLDAHDLLNALVWLALPSSKARLNALQAAGIARHGVGARRGPLRDAATLLDENGVLLVTDDAEMALLLRERRWHELFIARRLRWSTVRALVCGHALMAKLAAPYKAITGHALLVALPAATAVSEVDAHLAAGLDDGLNPSVLMPLPVLGIPGWCAANADPAFYDDGAVFRAARGASAGSPRG